MNIEACIDVCLSVFACVYVHVWFRGETSFKVIKRQGDWVRRILILRPAWATQGAPTPQFLPHYSLLNETTAI